MLIKNKHMASKIQKLIGTWPEHAVRTVAALKKLGYSQDLINCYRYSGWLTSVGEGAVTLSKNEVTLYGAFYALQQDLKLNVHVGGISSLELKGRAHYIRSGRQTVWIFGEVQRLPAWFLKFKWKEKLHLVGDRFHSSYRLEGLEPWSEDYSKVLVSGEIRSMLELLSLAPKEQSIEEAKELMMGLTNAHPKVVQKLLLGCKSVKAKRLFLLLAELCGHRWVERLDRKVINLGKGARHLVSGGKFDSKYQITVPKTLYAEG